MYLFQMDINIVRMHSTFDKNQHVESPQQSNLAFTRNNLAIGVVHSIRGEIFSKDDMEKPVKPYIREKVSKVGLEE